MQNAFQFQPAKENYQLYNLSNLEKWFYNTRGTNKISVSWKSGITRTNLVLENIPDRLACVYSPVIYIFVRLYGRTLIVFY